MAIKRKTTAEEKAVFAFLNDLRESGKTNMFGASTYVTERFPEVGAIRSRNMVSLWMSNFNADGDYEVIEE